MRARTMLAILAVLLPVVAGCGSTHTARPAVSRYIRQVNAIEAQLDEPLESVTKTGSQFASSASGSGGLSSLSALAQEQALVRAESEIRAIAARLAAIPAPAGAVPLRTLVLKLVNGEAAMTGELRQLVTFLPRFSATLKPLAPATTTLRTALAATPASGVSSSSATAELAAKARALTSYQHVTIGVIHRLRALDPPPVTRPQYNVEVKALTEMESDAGRLANALRTDGSGIQQLLASFDRAAVATETTSAQRAQIAAIRAYDKRVARLTALSQQVAAERVKLNDTLT